MVKLVDVRLEYENMLLKSGITELAGVDEVGRGPLAGPVVTACVRLDVSKPIAGVTDSKLLSPARRNVLFEQICDAAKEIRISIIDNFIIDQINILNATKRAMCECITAMQTPPDCVLIDAVQLPDVGVPTLSIVGGDALSYLIGAASIVAKVTRDKLMCEYAKHFIGYGFENNMGYATKRHIDGLRLFGACEIHRKSFLRNFADILPQIPSKAETEGA